MDIELNSCESVVPGESTSVYNASQAVMAIKNMTAALSVLVEASRERAGVVETVANKADAGVTAGDVNVVTSDLFSLNGSYALIDTAVKQLSSEAFTAIAHFNGIDAAAELAAKLSEVEVDGDAAANKQAVAHGKKESDDANWTPAQKAAAEKKRKEKEEKAAAKAAAKAAKKGNAGVTLGAGATLVRSFVNARAVSAAAAESKLTVDRVAVVLNPFDVSEDSFSAQCTKILEQLNSSGTKRKPKIPKGRSLSMCMFRLLIVCNDYRHPRLLARADAHQRAGLPGYPPCVQTPRRSGDRHPCV